MGEKSQRRYATTTRGETIKIFDVSIDPGLPSIATMSQTIALGGFGKFRVATGPRGEKFAVKEIRLKCDAQKVVYGPEGQYIYPKTSFTEPESFRKEMRMGYKIPDFKPIERVIDIKGKWYAFMPYMDGGNGLDLIDVNVGRLSDSSFGRTATALGFLDKFGSIFYALHAQRLVHGDVKLENFLWSRNGEMMISDLGGMGRVISGVSLATSYTQAHLPIEFFEIFSCQYHTPSTDIFALGKMVYDLYDETLNEPRKKYEDEHYYFGSPKSLNRFYNIREDYLSIIEDRQNRILARSRASRVGRVFTAMLNDHREMAEFVIRKVFEPDYERRANAVQVMDFAKKLNETEHQNYFLWLMTSQLNKENKTDRIFAVLGNPTVKQL